MSLKFSVVAEYGASVNPLLRIPNKLSFRFRARQFLCESQSLATLGSRPQRSAPRGGTRVPCEIPVILSSLDPRNPFSEPCQVILANLAGCAVRSPRPLPPGSLIHLKGLPTSTEVTARVVNCFSLGQFEKLWILGLALDESGNIWGIEPVPDDWLP